MYGEIGNRSAVPALLALAVFYLSFGLFAIFRPAALRNVMDKFANAWNQGSWHPYKMSLGLLRVVVGGTGMLVAALLLYIAFTILRR